MAVVFPEFASRLEPTCVRLSGIQIHTQSPLDSGFASLRSRPGMTGKEDDARTLLLVMPGLVPGIHALRPRPTPKTWMAGTSSAMTKGRKEGHCASPKGRMSQIFVFARKFAPESDFPTGQFMNFIRRFSSLYDPCA